MLALVGKADGKAGFLAGDIDDTPGEVNPGFHILDVGRDFAGVEPFETATTRRTSTRRGRNNVTKACRLDYTSGESLTRKK